MVINWNSKNNVGTLLSGINISSYDNASSLQASNITSVSGKIRQALYQYTRNNTDGTEHVYYNNYTINASYGAETLSYSQNISMNRQLTFTFGLNAYVPTYDLFDGATTNFSAYNSTELMNISFATIEKTTKAKIVFLQPINVSGANLNTLVDITDHSIIIDSQSDSRLNQSANISFYNVDFKDPQLLEDGAPCTSCQFLEKSGSSITYNVSHFTNYTVIDGTTLTIWDSVENSNADVGGLVWFYANYSNSTGLITGATCNLTLQNGTSYLMDEDATKYNYSASFAASGIYSWTVSCNASGYAWLNVTDNVVVATTPSISFINPTPGNAEFTSSGIVHVNTSITADSLENITYDWNGTNFTFFDKDVLAWYNFNNRTALGDRIIAFFKRLFGLA